MNLPEIAARVDADLTENCSWHGDTDLMTIAMVEEAGEAAGAYRRWRGCARRKGTIEELEDEIADVLLTTCILALNLGIDIDQAVMNKVDKIYSRGWNE